MWPRPIHPECERRRLSDAWHKDDPPPPPEKRIPLRNYPGISRAEKGDTHYVKLPNMTEERRFRNRSAALRYFEAHAEAAGVRTFGRQPKVRTRDEGDKAPSPDQKPCKRPRTRREAASPPPEPAPEPTPEPAEKPAEEPAEETPAGQSEWVKGPWRKIEDDLLSAAVKHLGPKRWTEIARYVPGRIGKQCRERWHNYLDPNVKLGNWCLEEELTLERGVSELGHLWSAIARRLPGRTDAMCKNRWHCIAQSRKQRRPKPPSAPKAPPEAKPTEELGDAFAEELNEALDRELPIELLGESLPAEEQLLNEDENRAFAAMLSYYAEDPMYGLLAVEELPDRDDEFETELAWTRSSRWVVGESSRVKYSFAPAPTTWQPPITDYMPVTRLRLDTRPPATPTMKWTAVGKSSPLNPAPGVPSAIAAGGLAVPALLRGHFAHTASGFSPCLAAC